jgi:hypothetical protein
MMSSTGCTRGYNLYYSPWLYWLLLNDHRWGTAATGVDYIAQHYLSD